MDAAIPKAISAFFDAVSELRKLGVIRSDKYLGDLAEYICTHFYEIELASSGRQIGHDGIDCDGFVQVKYHGSCTRTNIDLGNPDLYDHVLVELGKTSLLRSSMYTDDFLVYRMSSNSVRQYKNEATKTYSCGKKPFERNPDQVFNLTATVAQPHLSAAENGG